MILGVSVVNNLDIAVSEVCLGATAEQVAVVEAELCFLCSGWKAMFRVL